MNDESHDVALWSLEAIDRDDKIETVQETPTTPAARRSSPKS